MAEANLIGTVDFYIMRRDDLTAEVSDITSELVKETKQSVNLATDFNNQKAAVGEQYTDKSSDDYKNAMAEVQDQYNLKLADITALETELQNKKTQDEAEIKEITSYIDGARSMTKENIKKDFTYGDASQ